MAQQTKNSSKRKSSESRKTSASGSGSRPQGSGRSAASKRPSSKRNRSNGASSRAKRAGTGGGRSRSAVAEAASRAKTPLVAGGTALIGVAAGAALRGRRDNRNSKNPLRRLRGAAIPKSVRNADFSKIDLDTVKKAAERVSAYGQQASDIAVAVEKTRKKNK